MKLEASQSLKKDRQMKNDKWPFQCKSYWEWLYNLILLKIVFPSFHLQYLSHQCLYVLWCLSFDSVVNVSLQISHTAEYFPTSCTFKIWRFRDCFALYVLSHLSQLYFWNVFLWSWKSMFFKYMTKLGIINVTSVLKLSLIKVTWESTSKMYMNK